MSFLTRMTSQLVAKGNITPADLSEVYKQKISSKYKVEYQKKGSNVLTRAMSGNDADKVLVSKNGYHRTFITTHYDSATNETYFVFDEATVSGKIKMLANIAGPVLVNLCYGKGKEFYADVVNVIKENYKPDERTINTGLSALWKKDKS